jgi:poly-gamma-glutamate synthesis protein (capsule biosynthesis protein)
MMQPQSETLPTVRLMFGGDVMLGRIVKEYIARYGPEYPLGQVADLLRRADLAIVNLECAITSSCQTWHGAPKAFYFGAPLQAIQSLSDAGIDLVSLANNHTLDFEVQGLLDTLHQLCSHGIRYVGAGTGIEEALSPAIIDCHGMKFGMAAFCDHQADFSAQQNRPGIAYLDLDNEAAAIAAMHQALQPMQHAAVDWPILSMHWGPNMVRRPSARLRRLAHAAIDMGWKTVFGHSAHVFHGIEFIRGCPILYAAGDLVDDYYVDSDFRNDHQILFEIVLTRRDVIRINLHPIFIEDCRVCHATPNQAKTIMSLMTSLCGEMGTHVQQEAGTYWIDRPMHVAAS